MSQMSFQLDGLVYVCPECGSEAEAIPSVRIAPGGYCRCTPYFTKRVRKAAG